MTHGFYKDEDGAIWFRFGEWAVVVKLPRSPVGQANGAWKFEVADQRYRLELIQEVPNGYDGQRLVLL
jgi:hypothetical protein